MKIVDFNGIRAHCRVDTADEDIGRSVIIEDEYGVRRFAKNGEVFVDIGAYCGHASILAVQCGMKAVAIEPLPENMEIIRKNAALNSTKIEVIEGAIGREEVFWNDWSSDFNARHRFIGNRVAYHEGGRDCPGVSVSVRRINLDVELASLPRIYLLKTDCEGGEWCLPEAATTLEKTRYIVGEFHATEGNFATFRRLFPGFEDVSNYRGDLEASLRLFTFENRNVQ